MDIYSANVSRALGLGGVNGTVAAPSAFIDPQNTLGIFYLFNSSFAVVNAGRFFPLIKNGSLYQVPAGKTCKVLQVWAASGTTGATFQLVDDSATFAVNSAALTSGKYQGGSAGGYTSLVHGSLTIPIQVPGTYEFAAERWPGVQVNSAASYYFAMLCIEVDA